MIETEARLKVLKYSLEIEHFVSDELAKLLDIRDFKNSKSFGNKSTSLSLNQKLNLLLDCESISSTEKSIMESFITIRNQFMHNIDANSFELAINQIDGLLSRLKKLYPNNFIDLEIEKSLENCVDLLYLDSLKILSNEKGNKLRKTLSKLFAKGNGVMYETLRDSMNKNIAELENFIENYKEDKIPKIEIAQAVLITDLKILIDLTDVMKLNDTELKNLINMNN